MTHKPVVHQIADARDSRASVFFKGCPIFFETCRCPAQSAKGDRELLRIGAADATRQIRRDAHGHLLAGEFCRSLLQERAHALLKIA